jgi:hypothetical protein
MIRDSKNRGLIEIHLDSKFRRVLSVMTLWELLDAIRGGDETHFEKDLERLRIAAGNPKHPLVLPTPVPFAIQHVLKRPAPSTFLTPKTYERIFSVVMRAKNWVELCDKGVTMPGAVNQRKKYRPEIVWRQIFEGELQYVRRLEARRLSPSKLPPPELWASLLAKDLGVTVSEVEAQQLASGFDAAYRFYEEVWNMVVKDKNYNVENNKNDWIDMQQTMYLCDEKIFLMTCDNGIITKTKRSSQATRILYLPSYLSQQRIQL